VGVRVVGSVKAHKLGGISDARPVALVHGSSSPRVLFARDFGDELWLATYDIDAEAMECERTVNVPALDPVFGILNYRSPEFAVAEDVDGDGVDDLVGFWMPSEGAGVGWPRARVVVWSSGTLAELRAESLFDEPTRPSVVYLRSVHRATGNATRSLVLVAPIRSAETSNSGAPFYDYSVFSYAFATGRRTLIGTSSEYLADPVPVLDATNGSVCGIVTTSRSSDDGQLLNAGVGAGSQSWRRSVSDLSSGRLLVCDIAPDVDSRGVTDLLASFELSESRYELVCVAGEDGAVLWSMPSSGWTQDACHVGDVDRDGAVDVMLAQTNEGKSQECSPVLLRSGLTGEVLWDGRGSGMERGLRASLATRVDSQGAWCVIGDGTGSTTLLRITALD